MMKKLSFLLIGMLSLVSSGWAMNEDRERMKFVITPQTRDALKDATLDLEATLAEKLTNLSVSDDKEARATFCDRYKADFLDPAEDTSTPSEVIVANADKIFDERGECNKLKVNYIDGYYHIVHGLLSGGLILQDNQGFWRSPFDERTIFKYTSRDGLWIRALRRRNENEGLIQIESRPYSLRIALELLADQNGERTEEVIKFNESLRAARLWKHDPETGNPTPIVNDAVEVVSIPEYEEILKDTKRIKDFDAKGKVVLPEDQEEALGKLGIVVRKSYLRPFLDEALSQSQSDIPKDIINIIEDYCPTQSLVSKYIFKGLTDHVYQGCGVKEYRRVMNEVMRRMLAGDLYLFFSSEFTLYKDFAVKREVELEGVYTFPADVKSALDKQAKPLWLIGCDEEEGLFFRPTFVKSVQLPRLTNSKRIEEKKEKSTVEEKKEKST